jgi:hypothetical protein
METHKPKPVRNWRDFLKEVGSIVLGVSIALAAEQAVEAIHWHYKVRDAAQAMGLELRGDARQAFMRVAIKACYDRQLDAIQGAIEQGRDRQQITALIHGYRPILPTWDSEAWKAVLASDVGSHVPAAQMIRWAATYSFVPELQRVQSVEHADWKALQPFRTTSGKLSQTEEETMLAAIQHLRDDNRIMSGYSRTVLAGLKVHHMTLTDEWQSRVLKDLRAFYPDCLATPSLNNGRSLDPLIHIMRDRISEQTR